ncbi:MAG: hypothetical protein GC150_16455 [Rhizobiales bacterium]|nr:hypothetical protein [Hyphomicrobiales bacterium]
MSTARARRDRRRFGRRTTSLHGWVRVRGLPAIACMVRNVSQKGALLVLDRVVRLPYFFELEIEVLEFRGPVEIRHQSGARVGVFLLEADIDMSLLDARAPAEPLMVEA